ncbi:MAG: 3-deoxy-D-manno-octulosonic acid kinase [Steroidobacteraceae bacterium]
MFQRLAVDRGAILFDSERVAAPGRQLFERNYWSARGALTEQTSGRGSIHFIDGNGHRWVMRRYLRGGMAALVARDHYVFLGEERTRSFRELRLLEALKQLDLPVPAPIAACYRREFVTYTAALITERLPGASSLSEMLASGRMNDARWAAIGRCLRRFHDSGVQHADLNAHNIMLGESGEVWLLDFDRGRLREPGAWHGRVLDRLARSLAKISNGTGEWQSGFALLRLAHDG